MTRSCTNTSSPQCSGGQLAPELESAGSLQLHAVEQHAATDPRNTIEPLPVRSETEIRLHVVQAGGTVQFVARPRRTVRQHLFGLDRAVPELVTASAAGRSQVGITTSTPNGVFAGAASFA